MSGAERRRASAIAQAVNQGRMTALAVMKDTLERIAAYDAIQPQIWISRFAPDDLLAAARSIDARVAAVRRSITVADRAGR